MINIADEINLKTGTKICLITDSNVSRLYLEDIKGQLLDKGYQVVPFIIPAGEEEKNLNTVSKIYALLAKNSFSRTDCIVALGGGVVTDISGFSASTFLRGIKYISIPTTLLAMVDAAHGGKCGVDLPEGKNLVGAFYQPERVIVREDFLKTLPDNVFSQGMAEVIKYAFIMDLPLYEMLEGNDFSSIRNDKEFLKQMVNMCISDKDEVVSEDRLDYGRRHILNFGHTVGHAYEQMSDYKLSHGDAVSLGMLKVVKASAQKGYCGIEVYDKLLKMLKSYRLMIEPDREYDLEEVVKRISVDKKHDGNLLSLVILKEIAKADLLKISQDQIYGFLCI